MIWGGLNMRMDNTGGSTWHLSCYVAKVVLNAGPKDNYHSLPSGPASRQGMSCGWRNQVSDFWSS